MERHKRKRVFSLQPNNNSKAVFVRRYVSHLVPALNKINLNKPSSDINHQSYQQTVKHEVDMAFALSAQEFAWSRFLQHKLLSSKIEDRSSNYKMEGEQQDHDVGGGGEINKRVKELQKLLPGGEEMNMDEILNQIGSYIVCLELQMIVLKSLVQR